MNSDGEFQSMQASEASEEGTRTSNTNGINEIDDLDPSCESEIQKEKTNLTSSVPDNSTIDRQPNEVQKEGREWNLLSDKVKTWWGTQNVETTLGQIAKPALLIIALLGILFLLEIYGNLLGTIEKVPLAPRLLEFAGIIWLIRFYIKDLARSEDRQEVLSSLKNRWNSFLGDSENQE